MKYIINNKAYEVVIIRKANKNTYIRIKEDLKIYVTTSYFTSSNKIKLLLDNNLLNLEKMLNRAQNKKERSELFYFLGRSYDIIIVPSLDIVIDDYIYVKSYDYLNKWLKKKTMEIFKERLDYIYNLFTEDIAYPCLKIRKMTSRWGVCNRVKQSITLNSELIKYGYEQIDYVIVHELSHFVYFDHSKNFWLTVNKYCPNYKQIRKSLKEG
ncbi:MAG: YgjP-like metallopeptidase domain-containing protein [Bacilli bacterium]